MKKMLILGANGMAGHMLCRYFRAHPEWEVRTTIRQAAEMTRLDDAFLGASWSLEATNFAQAAQILNEYRPDVVINAIGILNRHAEQEQIVAEIVNGLFPHWIADRLDELGDGGKLVQISTDCVFSGERGAYREDDRPDGTTTYARTKAAGEVLRAPHLTIRTSIIGPEIRPHGIGLLAWFMRQQGKVPGYTHVLWNGVTTLQLAKSIDIMLQHETSGMLHLTAPQMISKCELLLKFADIFEKRDVIIEPEDSIQLDRTLVSTRSDAAIWARSVPSYDEMLAELREWMWSS